MHRSLAPWSLRGRLVAIALLVCSATLLAGGAAMHRADEIADTHLLDARLVELAKMVLVFAEHEIEEAFAEGTANAIQETAETFASRYHYQIRSVGGTLLLRSHNASASAPIRPIAERGFGQAVVDGESVRTYAEASRKGGMVIVIAERMRERRNSMGEVTRTFLAFMIIPLALIMICIWALLNRALQSVEGYTSQLRARDPLALTDLNATNAPAEFRPLVESINALFGRFQQTLSV